MSDKLDGLNVCLMNDSFPPVIDGVATTILNYAEIINNGLGKATVVTPEYPGAKDDFPFPVVRYTSMSITEKICSCLHFLFGISVFRKQAGFPHKQRI